MLEFDVNDAPTLEELQRAQATVTPAIRVSLELRPALSGPHTGLLVDAHGRIFVADTNHLRLRLCIVAHQGLGGHRGSATTIHWLTTKFTWPGIERDIRTVCFACLHCLRTKGGKTTPRPWLNIPAATGPNEVIMFDYIYIRAAADDVTPEYVLIIVDGFSRFVWLSAHRHANAINTANAMMQWFGLFGVVRKWVSDQGRHFSNDVMEQLRARLGADHRFTTAYAPWSNGVVERVGRSLRETLSALISETKRAPETWPLLLPMVNSAINQSPSSAIGGHAPISAFTGRTPANPLDVVFASEPTEVLRPLSSTEVSTRIVALQNALSDITTAVREVTPRDHPTRPGETPVDFDVGDYVLVAVARRTTRRDKTAPLWMGPGLVVAAHNERSFVVQDLVNGASSVVHAEHLRRYADSSLIITDQLRSFVAAQAIITRVDAITNHQRTDGNWRLLVKWFGFTDEESTWEPLDSLYEDVPELVRRYVKALQDPTAKSALTAALRSIAGAAAAPRRRVRRPRVEVDDE